MLFPGIGEIGKLKAVHLPGEFTGRFVEEFALVENGLLIGNKHIDSILFQPKIENLHIKRTAHKKCHYLLKTTLFEETFLKFFPSGF